MKKLTTGFIAVVCILVLGSMTVFAAGQVQQRSSQQGGAADNSAERVYNHYNKYCSTESGCGYCGENGHCYEMRMETASARQAVPVRRDMDAGMVTVMVMRTGVK